MKKVNISLFYNFSKSFYELAVLGIGDSLSNPEVLRIILAAKIWIQFFLAETKEITLPHTKHVAEKLNEVLESLKNKRATDDSSEDQTNYTLSEHDVKSISYLIGEFERFLVSESRTVSVFTVTRKGIYEIEALIERAEQRFPESVRKHFPDTTIYDFREAGKCLAFECPTAMAFHMLRGTEALFLKYYELLAGKEWGKKNRNWGQYISALEKLNAPIAITQRLGEIRQFQRNPIIHPEYVVELDEALPMFDLVSGVIPLITKEIEKLEIAKNADSNLDT